MFHRKYGVMPHVLYSKIRDTKPLNKMLEGVWAWTCSPGYNQNFDLVEKYYCKVCKIKPDSKRPSS